MDIKMYIYLCSLVVCLPFYVGYHVYLFHIYILLLLFCSLYLFSLFSFTFFKSTIKNINTLFPLKENKYWSIYPCKLDNSSIWSIKGCVLFEILYFLKGTKCQLETILSYALLNYGSRIFSF